MTPQELADFVIQELPEALRELPTAEIKRLAALPHDQVGDAVTRIVVTKQVRLMLDAKVAAGELVRLRGESCCSAAGSWEGVAGHAGPSGSRNIARF